MIKNCLLPTTVLSASALLIGLAGNAGAQTKKPEPVKVVTLPAQEAPATTAEPLPEETAGLGMYSLDSFGPIMTAAAAKATYDKALAALQAAGGGVLLIPGSAPANWDFGNQSQGMTRTPAPPAPAKGWGTTPGVTVIDTRGGTVKIHPPQVSGLQLNRNLQIPAGQAAPHGPVYPMLELNNNVIHGSTSYHDFIQFPVKAGLDQRFYVPTIRGLFPGMFINGFGDHGVDRLYIKSLGYDKEKKMSYVVADTSMDHKAHQLLSNKTHINVIKMITNAHTELQSFDVMNERHHYSQGESTLYDASFHYMGNVHSTAGDENGVLFAAFSYSETNVFKAQVSHVNPGTDEVVFRNDTNAHTLGSGRPLINMNPTKWIQTGTVEIVRPGSYTDTPAENPWIVDPVFMGHTYPTTIIKNPRTGQRELSMGGLVHGSADTDWTQDIVGRYFAVDDPSERVGGTLRRWYLITALTVNPDGTKDIKIERHWWGAKQAGSPTLFQESNYSSDGHLKPLKYIITPGSNVYDVSMGVTDEKGASYDGKPLLHTLLIAPYSDRGTNFDFAPGDSVEQAVGPDPFKPIPFRAWTFDKVPSAYPAPMFDVANYGVPRSAVMSIVGAGTNGSPAFGSVINVTAHVNNVFDITGNIRGSAIHIGQGNRTIPIKWNYDGGKKEASLTVDNQTGVLNFDGGPTYASGGFITSGGLSGTSTPANNLRGIAVAVPAGSKSFFVPFPRPEVDNSYAVFLTTTWLSERAITERKPEGFTVTFDTPAPKGAQLDWTLVR